MIGNCCRRYKNIDVENTGWISYEELAETLGKDRAQGPLLQSASFLIFG